MTNNSFTLDDIIAAADAQYGHTEVAGVILQNPMRLTREQRAEFAGMRDKLSEADDAADVLKEMLTMVAKPGTGVESLLEKAGDDLAVLMTIFTKYSEGTQAGEA